ncbi:LysR family transcriptional regulator [Neptuniibacter caesariensis]|uniref:Transcriptional regulator, LysR family protein n=1 Tax=Neptuniibacter caesariensis TaxID=207954 RepID=A0A7U8GU52_NEPCE|nr:LysR family transcriptional regulator [Neptuniibacter caesariensis]EAR62815.1 transcriptional regulator, LysR family protein [Oceanospirillum sp. MED92] [Neptuniibacter caesariensis]
MNDHYWSGIRSFLAVAKCGSFTLAAEETGTSKASLSQQVSQLEKTLNLQLLYRTTRSIRLTEVGEGYLQRCEAAVAQLDAAQEWAVAHKQIISGTIKMNSVGGLIGESVIAPLLIEFQKHYPDICVELDFSSRRVDLLKDDYDLVLRMGDLPDSSLIARRLHQIKTCYVASPEFIQRQKPIRHPLDISGIPMICGSVTDWTFNKDQEQCQISFKQGFKIPNGRVMLDAAKSGLGVARLADIYVQPAIRSGALEEILEEWSITTPLSLVCPPARHQLDRVKLLMDWLVDNFPERYQHLLAE